MKKSLLFLFLNRKLKAPKYQPITGGWFPRTQIPPPRPEISNCVEC